MSMDYEKKYRDLVEAVKELQEANPSNNGIQNWVKDNVPELMESEDERIRKALVEHCKEQADIYKTLQTAKEYGEIQSWIAWLEKQGEYKTNYCKPEVDLSNCSEEYRKAYYDGYNKCNRDWQRQGEQKQPKELTNSEFVEKCKGLSRLEQHILALVPTRPIDAIKVDARTVRYLVEQEQGEQKHAEKVEPKFKAGDWVVWDNKVVCNITGYINENKKTLMYVITDTNGMERTYSINSFDNNARLWDITKDAKDGDVIANINNNAMPSICIFSNFSGLHDKYATLLCHCGVQGLERNLNVNGYHDDSLGYVPATKEQCDLLFQKMKEAGYEWDANKKVLKKIDQTPSWSNTDLISLGYLAYFVDKNGDKFYGKNKPNVVKWIQSLANFTAPQREWSEEDKVRINRIVAFLEKLNLEYLNVAGNDILLKDIDWLKSLKDKYSWKPNEEQMDCLNSILRFGNVSQTSYKHLNSLINDLKKLKG